MNGRCLGRSPANARNVHVHCGLNPAHPEYKPLGVCSSLPWADIAGFVLYQPLRLACDVQTREAARAAELRRGARVIEAQLEERAADRARQEELREQASNSCLSTPSVCIAEP